MSFTQILFYVFSAVLVVSSIGVITARNPVHSALFLVFAFFNSAVIWLLLEAEFLAIVLVLVYVGAVMVLFLFVVMMLDINLERLREGFWRNLPAALVVGGLMAFEMISVLAYRVYGMPRPNEQPLSYSNTKELGRLIYTDYVYAFEIAAVVLLVAIIAAIALTLRRRKDTKAQDPSVQVRARPGERVRLVSMPTEKDD